MSCLFTKIFVNLLIIAAVWNFNVYKLIGGTKQTFTCSKPLVETLEKGVKRYEICSKLAINTAERLCGDFIITYFTSFASVAVAIVHYEQMFVEEFFPV